MLLMIFQYGAVYFGHRLGVGVKKKTHFARFITVLECYFTAQTGSARSQSDIQTPNYSQHMLTCLDSIVHLGFGLICKSRHCGSTKNVFRGKGG